MRVAITGATSFLGRHLVRQFVEAGHRVFAIARHDCEAFHTDGVELVECGMEDYGHLHGKIRCCDVLVNLAWGGTGHSGRDLTDVQERNVEYALDAIRSAHRMGCRLFVEAGSQAEYGICHGLTGEESPCAPFSEYGKAKLRIKEEGAALCAALGMGSLHLRIFSLFGEDDHPWTLVMSSLDRMLRGEDVPLSECLQSWNFMYVGDAAECIVRLCGSCLTEGPSSKGTTAHEVYNIAAAESRPLRDYVERMRVLSDSRSRLLYGAVRPGRVVSLFPDVTRLADRIGGIPCEPFDDVILRIIETKRQTGASAAD